MFGFNHGVQKTTHALSQFKMLLSSIFTLLGNLKMDNIGRTFVIFTVCCLCNQTFCIEKVAT